MRILFITFLLSIACLAQPQGRNNATIEDKQMQSKAHVSHFGALKVSPTYPVLKANFPGSAIDTSLWDSSFVGTGSITVEKGVGRLFTGTGTTGSVKLISDDQGIFEAGQITVYQSGVYAGAGVASNTRRWGMMDASEQNGLFFEWDGTTFQITARKGGTDSSVTTANFNGNANWEPGNSNNTYRIHYSAGRALFQRASNGQIILLHKFINSAYPLVDDLDMGLYYENTNSGNNTSVELRVRGASTSVFGELPTTRPESSINSEDVLTLNKSVITGRSLSGTYKNIGVDRFGNLLTAPFGIGVSNSEFPKLSVVHKFGRNSDVDTGSDPETIWEAGGLKVWQTVADQIDIVSSSGNDAAAGTGARTIEIEGVNGSYVHVKDTITLNGTSTVTSTLEFLNVYRAKIVTAGSGGNNAGTITGTFDGTTDDAFGILPGFNQSQLAFYTTADGETANIMSVSFFPFRQASASYEIGLFIREFGGLFRLRGTYGGHSQASGVTVQFPIPFSVPEKSDIEFRLIEVSANNSSVALDFIILSEME